MRTILNVVLALIAAVLAIWLIGNITATSAMKRAANEPWPMNLGTLASLEQRVRPQPANDAARRLLALTAPLENEAIKSAIGNYVKGERRRADATIGELPHEVVEHLFVREAEIDALRDHLLQTPSIQWEIDTSKGLEAPAPNLLAYMKSARVLTARALYLARENDARAWDDLHAVWRLSRSLESRPELISQVIYLDLTRSLNALAWKLPQPAAAWFGDVQKVDHRRLLTAAVQYDTWMMSEHNERTMKGIVPVVARPYYRWSTVNIMQHQLATAEQLAAKTACRFDGAAFSQTYMDSIPRWNVVARIAIPNIAALWQRAFRATAEREATANAMRIASGQSIVTTSACSDGSWTYDGARLSFSRDLPASNSVESPMPLSLAIPARATRRST